MVAAAMALLALPAFAAEVQNAQPDPDGKPVKVFILSGQSNMVGAGKVTGGDSRWGSEFIDPVVSVYEGAYDPKADYDAMKPVKTLKLESFGGVRAYALSGWWNSRDARVHSGQGDRDLRVSARLRGSTHNIMEVDGKEVHRREVGQESVCTEIKLTEGKRVPFKITYLTKDANGLGWIDRLDVPGTLATLVKHQGKYPYLIEREGTVGVAR